VTIDDNVLPELVGRLGRLDTCAVSDAMDMLQIDGVVTGLSPVTGKPKVFGRVVTVQIGIFDPSSPSKVHLGARSIVSASPGDVIVVANDGRIEMGAWGGLLSLAAKIKGIAGVIVDGSVRDADEAAALGLPLFARSTVPRTARGRVAEVSTNDPVTIAGVRIEYGDLLLADGTGVVVLPSRRAHEIVAAAEVIVARELSMARELYNGTSIIDVMGHRYENMLEKK